MLGSVATWRRFRLLRHFYSTVDHKTDRVIAQVAYENQMEN